MATVRAKVLFEYDAEQEDELTLAVGDIVTNIEQLDEGWWEGELHGKRGLFPENFVEIIEEKPMNVPKPAATSKSSKIIAKVTFGYDAAEPDELSLKEGDIIQVLNQEDEGWWEGLCNGKKGVFPSNFVQLIEDSMEKKLPTPLETPKNETKSTESDNELIHFDEKPPPANDSPANPSPHANMVEEETKKTKVSGVMGFPISNADLFKTKLRPVSMISDGKKGVEAVETKEKNTPVSKARISSDAVNVKRNAPAPPSSESVPSTTEERYKIMFDYVPENDDELALQKGDIVIVTNKNICDGWWEGTRNGQTGMFPNNFVETTPLIDVPPKEKPMAKKPMLPAASKAPPLPARESKESSSESKHSHAKKPMLPESRKPELEKPPVQDLNKPALPEARKPALPELKKPIISEDKKPEGFKRPPPPAAKAKAIPPRPNEKPSVDEINSSDFDRNKDKLSNAVPIVRIPSIGKKPIPPQPNGLNRTGSASMRRPVPVPQNEPKPDVKTLPKPLPSKPKPLDENDEQGIEWDKPSNAQVLSNVNKDRVKGPGKALPGKYSQTKEKLAEDSELPPWKKEIAQKEELKAQEGKEKKPSQPQAIKNINQPTDNVVNSTASQPGDNSIVEDLKMQLKSMSIRMEDIEKKLLKHIKVLTNDVDEERKQNANLLIEVDRLKKRVAVLEDQ